MLLLRTSLNTTFSVRWIFLKKNFVDVNPLMFQWWFKAGPVSHTVGQHYPSFGAKLCFFCWCIPALHVHVVPSNNDVLTNSVNGCWAGDGDPALNQHWASVLSWEPALHIWYGDKLRHKNIPPPRRHDTLSQCWVHVGPASQTLGQH